MSIMPFLQAETDVKAAFLDSKRVENEAELMKDAWGTDKSYDFPLVLSGGRAIKDYHPLQRWNSASYKPVGDSVPAGFIAQQVYEQEYVKLVDEPGWFTMAKKTFSAVPQFLTFDWAQITHGGTVTSYGPDNKPVSRAT